MTNAPILRGKLRQGQGRRGNGEIHECIRPGEQRFDVGTDRNLVVADPTKLAGVAADHRRAPLASTAPASVTPSISEMA